MSNIETAAAPASRENVMSVYRRIRRMILSGRLKGGQVLSQVQLAIDFETSRGPVREALRMLQQEGLIEAETNQQGRIASYSVEDLEQVCALLTLNAAMAIQAGADRFTARDVTAVRAAIAQLEGVFEAEQAGRISPDRASAKRQIAFRRLLKLLCKYGGEQVTRLIDDLLDRIAMFRALHEMTGASPPYPLVNGFAELAAAAEARDATAMAAVIVERIADIARKALAYVAERYQPVQLDVWVAAARAVLVPSSRDLPLGFGGMTIRVRGLPGSRVECVVISDA